MGTRLRLPIIAFHHLTPAFPNSHRLIMFHTAHVLLHSNPNPSLVPSSTWIQSPFFSKALEHALKATAWLNFILQNFRATETPNVATGVSSLLFLSYSSEH